MNLAHEYDVKLWYHPLSIPDIFNQEIALTTEQICARMCAAIVRGEIEVLRMCLSKVETLNLKAQHGRAPLHFACYKSRPHCLELILAHPNVDVNFQDKMGFSGLILAITSRNPACVQRLLLCPETDPNIVNKKGESALLLGIKTLGPTIIRLLCERQADVNLTDKKGNSPLGIACTGANLETVNILLEYKADINQLDSLNRSPLAHAARKNRHDIVSRLLEVGGQDVDIHQRDAQSNLSPFENAIWKGHNRVIEAFLNSSCPPWCIGFRPGTEQTFSDLARSRGKRRKTCFNLIYLVAQKQFRTIMTQTKLQKKLSRDIIDLISQFVC